MLRHSRSDMTSVRRIRTARARRLAVLLMTICFATFISVANATAEDLGAAPEQQPTSEVVILVPAEQPAPAPVVEPAPAPEPAPVVEAAPAPVEVAAAAAEPVVEPVEETVQPQEKVESDEARTQVVKVATIDAPKERLAAVNVANACGNNKDNCMVTFDGASYVVGGHKVDICHASSNHLNSQNVDYDSIIPSGRHDEDNDHGSHDHTINGVTVFDIISPFLYASDADHDGTIQSDEVIRTYEFGLNLGTTVGTSTWSAVFNKPAGLRGQDLLSNGCAAPAVIIPPVNPTCPAGTSDFDNNAANGLDCRPPKPTDPDVVKVCHKNGDGTFSPATWTINKVVNVSHGLDANDVIPEFDYTTDWTWNTVTKKWDKVVGTFSAQNTGAIQTTITFPIVGPLTFNLIGADLLTTNCGTPAPQIPAKPKVTHEQITICHANNGVGSGYYNVQSVDDDSILTQGHGDLTPGAGQNHPYDIIPAFTYITDYVYNQTTNKWDAVTASYAGKNLGTFTRVVSAGPSADVTWTINGAAVGALLAGGKAQDADCAPAAPPAKPDVKLVPVRLCHSTGFNSWAPVDVADARTIVVSGEHASPFPLHHPFDVVPAFTYTKDYTYVAASNSWVAVPGSYAGKNLNNTQGFFTNAMTGNARLATNGCAPGKPALYLQVPVCHSGGNGAFTPATWAISNGDVTAGHGADADDVIPPFAYISDYTWQAGLGWVPQFKTFSGRNLGNFTRTITVPSGTVTRAYNGAGLLLTGCNVPAIPAKPKVTHEKITICHANNGVGSGYYNVQSVDDDAILTQGHGDLTVGAAQTHPYDIIPAFTYTTGYVYNQTTNKWDAVTASYAGKNLGTFTRVVSAGPSADVSWTINGAPIGALLAAGNAKDADCAPAAPPAKPDVADKVVSVCHATTDLDGFDTFVPATWTIVKGNVTAGHGLDSGDIIPSFAYIVDYAYKVATNTWEPVYAKPDYAGQNLGTFTKTMKLPVVGSVTWSLNGTAMLASRNCGFTQPAPKPPVKATPVTLCHATTLAGFDTYAKFVGTSDDVIAAGSHGSDGNDIIPAFSYTTGYTFDAASNTWNPVTHSYAGQNLGSFTRTMSLPLIGSVTRTLNGTTMLANSCQVPSLPVRPDIQPVSVTLCHAYNLDGIDYYSNVSTGHTSVLGAAGHDADANDVIPSFTYTTGYTYDHVTNTWIAQTASYDGKNLGSFTRTVNLASGPATLTFDGTAMLVAGTCPTPTVPTAADTTPTPTTPAVDVPGGGDEPDAVDADPIEPDVEAEADEPADEVVAAEDEDALPFTGLELGALLLIAVGALGAGTILHGGRRRRRAAAKR